MLRTLYANINSLNSSNSFTWLTSNTISLAHARITRNHNSCNGFFVTQLVISKLPILKGLWLSPINHFKKPAGLMLASNSLAEISSSAYYAKDSVAPEIFSSSVIIRKSCKLSSIFSSTDFRKLPLSEKVGSTKENT